MLCLNKTNDAVTLDVFISLQDHFEQYDQWHMFIKVCFEWFVYVKSISASIHLKLLVITVPMLKGA